jgi:hypothetical protein
MESVMRPFAILAASVALLAGTTAAHAVSFSFQTIDNPADPTFNQLLGINNSGVIAGYFGNASVGHPNKGYTVSTAAPTVFTPDNLPASTQTQATGINNHGVITGFWSPTNLGGGDANFGFIQVPNKNNTFNYLSVNDPKVSSFPVINQVLGINDNMVAAGFYNDSTGASHAFTYDVDTAQYTEIVNSGAVSIAATGLNNAGLVSGFLTNKGGRTIAFLKPPMGNFVKFSVVGASITQLLGVNNTGKAVGFFQKPGGVPHGVYLDQLTLNWVPVNDPKGAMGTTLNGLNDNNQIVGFYTDAGGNTHGMLVTVTP